MLLRVARRRGLRLTCFCEYLCSDLMEKKLLSFWTVSSTPAEPFLNPKPLAKGPVGFSNAGDCVASRSSLPGQGYISLGPVSSS